MARKQKKHVANSRLAFRTHLRGDGWLENRCPHTLGVNDLLPHRDIRHLGARQAIIFVASFHDQPMNHWFERGIDREYFCIQGP